MLNEMIANAPPETPESANISENRKLPNVQIPSEFRNDKKGLWKKATKEGAADTFISGPIAVYSESRLAGGGGWAINAEFVDRDGNSAQRTISRARLFAGDGSELIQELVSHGLEVSIAHKKELIQFLNESKPTARGYSVESTGYFDAGNGLACYVTPNECISSDKTLSVTLSSDEIRDKRSCQPRGTLEEWIEHVAGECKDDDASILAILVALSAPLLMPAGMDSGGIHFYGDSSSGKTTRLQIGASVFGCGADPAEQPDVAYIKRWNATANAMEVLAAISNDSALCLDEVGTCNARDFGKLVYDLFGGQGKQAMNASRNLKRVRSWRTSVISTGEISIKDKIENEKNQAKAGQLLRLIDIELSGGSK